MKTIRIEDLDTTSLRDVQAIISEKIYALRDAITEPCKHSVVSYLQLHEDRDALQHEYDRLEDYLPVMHSSASMSTLRIGCLDKVDLQKILAIFEREAETVRSMRANNPRLILFLTRQADRLQHEADRLSDFLSKNKGIAS